MARRFRKKAEGSLVDSINSKQQKEKLWDFSKVVVVVDLVVVVDSAGGRGRCLRQPAQSARRNVKFPSDPAETVQSTARIVFQNARPAAAKK